MNIIIERVIKMGFALSDLKLTSSAFEFRGEIPKKYTGEGENVSPPLE